MNNMLDMPNDRRRQVFEQTAARMNLAEIAVEKDFWVCWTLDKLFKLPCGQHLTFKGGTSLSKVWNLIDRFSEDIDITIHRNALGFGGINAPHTAPSKNQRKKRLDALKSACELYIKDTLLNELDTAVRANLSADNTWSLVCDSEDSQTLLFQYPGVFPAGAEYLRRWVKIEMGARADVEPADNVVIKSYVAETFPALIPDADVNVRALLPIRTFWEKVMMLHEEGFRPPGKKRKVSLARHYYDLYRMIIAGVADDAAADLELFQNIANQREMYFNYGWVDYSTYRPGQLSIVPGDEQLPDWATDYNNMKDEMFFGDPPNFEEIIKEVRRFQDKFNKVAA